MSKDGKDLPRPCLSEGFGSTSQRTASTGHVIDNQAHTILHVP